MRETQARMAVIAASTDRITSIVDETGSRIAGLAGLVPGAGGLLRARRSSGSQAVTVLPDSAPLEDGPSPEPSDDGRPQSVDVAPSDETVSLRSSA